MTDTINKDEFIKRVELAASRMNMQEPFIAAVFNKLERVYDTGGTAWTDGKRVGFNPEFCGKYSDAELLFISMHEALHVVLMHMWRGKGFNPRIFNIAADAIINRTLINLGYSMIDGGVLIDWVTEDMSTEEVYARLKDEMPPEGPGGGRPCEQGEQGDGEGEGESGGSGDEPWRTGGGGFNGEGDLAPSNDPAAEADMEATIVTAAKMAKACGKGGSLVDRIIGGALEPKARWDEVLRHVMTSRSRADYSYRRFNKRFVGGGLYLPALYSESMGGLVVGVDTSGSIGQEEIDQIAGEINAIAEDTNPDWIEVVYCDTKVAGTQRFEAGELVLLKPKGFGGTEFKPVFDYVAEMNERVAALVYFTDLCGDTECIDPPEYPVIWGVTYRANKDAKVPFGDIVDVTV